MFAAPSDYSVTQRQLTFTSGNTRIPVSIPIADDSDIEDVESFFANLEIDATVFPEVTVSPDQATINIISNDCKL